jgi:hypothetical protein
MDFAMGIVRVGRGFAIALHGIGLFAGQRACWILFQASAVRPCEVRPALGRIGALILDFTGVVP